MRERARDKGRLEDIVAYSDNVSEMIEGVTLDSLLADKRTYYAVMKNIEIIGEAAYMLTKSFKAAHPDTPWKIVQGMRHVLVHDYANIVSTTLYDTAVNGIPELRGQVLHYLAQTDWDEWIKGEDAFDQIDDALYKKNVETARKMRAKGFDIDDIIDITELSAEEIRDL